MNFMIGWEETIEILHVANFMEHWQIVDRTETCELGDFAIHHSSISLYVHIDIVLVAGLLRSCPFGG